jgi:chromatin segregation and condensation protein Rec8/ScpA/Scc1 (kleisin family)
MNYTNHPDDEIKMKKPHLTLVVNNTKWRKDALAEQWQEDRDSQNSQTKETEWAHAKILECIEKLRDMNPAIQEWLQYWDKLPKSRLSTIIGRFMELLNTIKNYK